MPTPLMQQHIKQYKRKIAYYKFLVGCFLEVVVREM